MAQQQISLHPFLFPPRFFQLTVVDSYLFLHSPLRYCQKFRELKSLLKLACKVWASILFVIVTRFFFLDFLTLATLLGTGVLGKTVTTSLSTWILSCFKYLIGSLELFLFMAEIVFGTISRIQSISLLDSTALLDLFCRSSCHVISMWAYPFSHHFYYHLAS